MDEFVEAFSGVLGDDISEDDLRRMFMKIDANSDGSVDWEEFSNFMLFEFQGIFLFKDSQTVPQ